MRQVLNVRVDRARRPDGHLLAIVWDGVERVRIASLRERHAVVGLLDHVIDREHRAGHAERLEDARLHELLPRLPRQQLDDVSRRSVHQVVVQKRRAQRLRWLEIFQPLEQFLPRERGLVPDQVVPRDAGAVRQHVPHADRGVERVVVELDARHVLPDRFVPVDLPLVHEQAHRDRGEELGVGGDRHDGRGRERQFLSVVAIAVAPGEYELVLRHDSDTDARDVPVAHHLIHVGVEAREFGGDAGVLSLRPRTDDYAQQQPRRGFPYRVRDQAHRQPHRRESTGVAHAPAAPVPQAASPDWPRATATPPARPVRAADRVPGRRARASVGRRCRG